MKYTNEEKYQLVLEAYNNAYAKYSHFQVGAVVFLKDGNYFKGANIENASYGLTNCAERNALFAAYSNGYRKDDIEELVIIANSKLGFTSPCGACRQVISELMNQDTIVVLMKLNKEQVSYKVKDLLPFAFSSGDMNE